MPKIIINDTTNLFFKIGKSAFQTTAVSECCLIKFLPHILPEKYIHILALESGGTASPGNRHCANCFGTLSFRVPVGIGYSRRNETEDDAALSAR